MVNPWTEEVNMERITPFAVNDSGFRVTRGQNLNKGPIRSIFIYPPLDQIGAVECGRLHSVT